MHGSGRIYGIVGATGMSVGVWRFGSVEDKGRREERHLMCVIWSSHVPQARNRGVTLITWV